MNHHAKAFATVLNMGANAGPGMADRIRKAVHVDKGTVPGMKGLQKDHKTNFDPVKGPPLRPLCNGKLGPMHP